MIISVTSIGSPARVVVRFDGDRLVGGDEHADAGFATDESLLLEDGECALGGEVGDAVPLAELGRGGHLVAGLELAGEDLSAEIGRDLALAVAYVIGGGGVGFVGHAGGTCIW